jgi:hypothetical protein
MHCNPYHKASQQHLAKLRRVSANPAARIIHQAQTPGAQHPSWAAAPVDINPDMVQHHQWATVLAHPAK